MKVFGISGHSGSGKTTLIEAMLPELAALGVRTSVIKHTHHDFQMEPPGKDSARFRASGAYEVMVCSAHRYAIVRDLDGTDVPSLDEQLARLAPCDLVLVEGYHDYPIPRLEVFRHAVERAPRCLADQHLVALASDEPLPFEHELWPLNEPVHIARLICQHLQIDTVSKGG